MLLLRVRVGIKTGSGAYTVVFFRDKGKDCASACIAVQRRQSCEISNLNVNSPTRCKPSVQLVGLWLAVCFTPQYHRPQAVPSLSQLHLLPARNGVNTIRVRVPTTPRLKLCLYSRWPFWVEQGITYIPPRHCDGKPGNIYRTGWTDTVGLRHTHKDAIINTVFPCNCDRPCEANIMEMQGQPIFLFKCNTRQPIR